ncbi:hypothetical protein [Rhodopirellula sp. SWK7]|uniref:hypothetical protein n=1 Tax=Rhodopirellula sp. SWK7 TaxID=595460 RepID=UPI0005C51433|nr:hypothetical protein [Rhodopirellula sp. SWK7]
MPSGWSLLQRHQIESLSGTSVRDWRCTEMSLESLDEQTPVWRHISVDALQCAVIDFLADNGWQRFHTLPGDDPMSDYGIVVRDAPDTLEPVAPDTTIYRNCLSLPLPRGLIQSVETTTNSHGTIGCVTLKIETALVSLSAGEFYAVDDGGYRVAEFDVSVLVRLNGRHPSSG